MSNLTYPQTAQLLTNFRYDYHPDGSQIYVGISSNETWVEALSKLKSLFGGYRGQIFLG